MKNKENKYITPLFPTWCPGCGNYGIWRSVRQALSNLNVPPHQLLIFYGIGCSGNTASYINSYGLHSLHGRAIPGAAGAKIANHELEVLVMAGDGDQTGEGLNHFIHAARANHDITLLMHNNEMYSLTTGQASPTSKMGLVTKTTPEGVMDVPINPCQLAILNEAGFVSRGFAGDIPHLTEIIEKAIKHPGFSLVEILQPCVVFNQSNSSEYLRKKISKVLKPTNDKMSALKVAEVTEKNISTGIIYRNDRPAFHHRFEQIKSGTLLKNTGKPRNIMKLLLKFT